MTSPSWVDTHCHVYDEAMHADHDAVLSAARSNGVSKMIVIGTDATTSRQAIDIAAKHDDVWATVGLHPHDAKDGFDFGILEKRASVDGGLLRRRFGGERAQRTEAAQGNGGVSETHLRFSMEGTVRTIHKGFAKPQVRGTTYACDSGFTIPWG